MATFYIAVKTQADLDALRKMHGNQQIVPDLESWKKCYTVDGKFVYYRVHYNLGNYPCCCGLTLASGAYVPDMLLGSDTAPDPYAHTFTTVLNYVKYVKGYMRRDIIASDVTGGKLHKLLDALTEFCAKGVYTKRVLYEFINPSTGNTVEVVSYQHKKVKHLGREE